MKEQLISIIVPVYNVDAYLDRCVRSIIAQSYSLWELLLIDDASIDHTPALCDAWEKKDERIRVFHESVNRGVSAGRNKGLREARGEYLTFVDADDWLLSDCLERLYSDMQRPGVEIAGCAFCRCTDDNWIDMQEKMRKGQRKMPAMQAKTSFGKEQPVLIAGKDFFREGILKSDNRCWSKLYRKDVVAGHFFREDYTIGEDMLFLKETTQRAKLISCSSYQGYCYYHNVNGAMLKPFRKTDMDQIRCWQLVLADVQGLNNHVQNENNQIVYDNDVISKTASILLISCMLTAGKLALLSADDRKVYRDSIEQCGQILKNTLRVPGAFELLDRNYRIKVRFFAGFPRLYLSIYHIAKKIVVKRSRLVT